MTIDQLMHAATIIFPASLSLKETKQLLDYLSENLPADINARIEYFENRYKILGGENETMRRSRGTVTISGTIRTKNYAFDSFITQHASNTSRIQAMQFQTIPGYSLEEHREEVRNLWQDVRQQVKNYFDSIEQIT
ncbi:MAG: hypothetical protein AABX16_01150 [Nanoarchaeota archaeon]